MKKYYLFLLMSLFTPFYGGSEPTRKKKSKRVQVTASKKSTPNHSQIALISVLSFLGGITLATFLFWCYWCTGYRGQAYRFARKEIEPLLIGFKKLQKNPLPTKVNMTFEHYFYAKKRLYAKGHQKEQLKRRHKKKKKTS